MAEKGTLFFITGLAGAGKSTIGRLFYERLKALRPNVVFLDGDKQRNIAGQQAAVDTGVLEQDDDRIYSTEARKRGAIAAAPQYRDMVNEGNDVVLCTISMYREVRDWYRENIEHYVEIYICVQRETLYRRNQKGLYSPGRRNVVGVDLPWDEPESPDVLIHNDGKQTPEEIVDMLAKRLL